MNALRDVSTFRPTDRFSDRVENYVKYRPGYPPGVLALMREEMALTPSSVVADIGSGTGLLARLFLENGCAVYGVEPNREMREIHNLRISSVETAVVHLYNASTDLYKAQEKLAAKMIELAEAQAHTDRRLSALIDIVQQGRGGTPEA